MELRTTQGFTLIELLVVIAIIGLLASTVLASLRSARDKASTARAQADLNQLRAAVEFLISDTGLTPIKGPDNCIFLPGANEIALDQPEAGISATDGGFSNWNGPYISPVPPDPWGNQYIFDEDYVCTGVPVGCENVSPTASHRALVSGGPNGSGINVYDADNIVHIICAR